TRIFGFFPDPLAAESAANAVTAMNAVHKMTAHCFDPRFFIYPRSYVFWFFNDDFFPDFISETTTVFGNEVASPRQKFSELRRYSRLPIEHSTEACRVLRFFLHLRPPARSTFRHGWPSNQR